MSSLFQELFSNPLALFLFVLVIIHMSVITFRSYTDYRQSKANLSELKKQLYESEARIQAILKRMDQNRDELIGDLRALNDEITGKTPGNSSDFDKAKANETR